MQSWCFREMRSDLIGLDIMRRQSYKEKSACRDFLCQDGTWMAMRGGRVALAGAGHPLRRGQGHLQSHPQCPPSGAALAIRHVLSLLIYEQMDLEAACWVSKLLLSRCASVPPKQSYSLINGDKSFRKEIRKENQTRGERMQRHKRK